jgi:TP901 family phage tail tape measure protein
MASNLDRIASVIRKINLDAEKTADLFTRLSRISGSIEMGRVTGDPALTARATAALEQYTVALERLHKTQQRAAQSAAQTRTSTIYAPRGKPSLGEEVAQSNIDKATKAATERQRLFREQFGLTSQGVLKAERALNKYGLSMNDLSKVYTEPISKTREFTFTMTGVDGVTSKATLAVDRFGNVIASSGTKFRSFEDMITRNIGKVLEWAIAVGVVYGAFQQLSQAVGYLREIDEQMADIEIATGKTGDDLAVFFDQAVMAARETGTTLDGVLGIYDDAIRATSSIANETQRYEVANTLLVDSLKFSRLAGIDQATAMDTMVGALRQLGPATKDIEDGMDRTAAAFGRSGELLDVLAFVSEGMMGNMNDLAQTFAITGAAAASAGVEMEDLASIASVMSEATAKSATEVGNTIRRMILTLQSETGQKALLQYGIAFEDANQKAREFDDIMTEIAVKYRQGVLDESALRELGYALGGGARGGADIQALVKNYDQVVLKANAAREGAEGAASEQLATKYDTLNTSINALSVSFKELIETLGTDGGFLEVITKIVEALDLMVQGMDHVAGAMDGAAAKTAILVTAFAAMQRYWPAGRAATEFMGAPFASAAFTPPGGVGPTPSVGRTLRGQAGSMAVPAMMAGMQLLGDAPMDEKLARAGGTLAGAVIGTLTGAGPVIGGAIGSAIVSTLVAEIKGLRLDRRDIELLDADELAAQFERAQQQAFNRISPLGPLTGLFGDEKKWQEIADKAYSTFKEEGIDKAIAEIRPDVPFGGILDTKSIEQYFERRQELEAAMREQGIESPETADALEEFYKARNDTIAGYNRELLKNQAATSRARRGALQEFIAGDLTRKEYTDIVKGQEDATRRVGMLYHELESETDISLFKMADQFANFSEEARDELISLVSQITTLEDAMVIAADEAPEEIPQMTAELKELRQALIDLYNAAQMGTLDIEPFKFKGFTDFEGTEEEFRTIMQAAAEEQAKYAEQLGIDPEDMVGSVEDWVAHFQDIYESVDDVHQAFVMREIKRWKEAQEGAGDFNLQRLKDISPEKIPELDRLVRYWETYLNTIPGYAEQAEEQPFSMIFGEENVAHRLVTTQEALRFAIEDLTEVEKKQLEGMWNIPEGATVMVPLQSLYYAPKGGGGLQVPDTAGVDFGGEGTGAITGLDQPANKMDAAGDKMLMAADGQMQQSFMWQKAIEAFPEGFGPEEPTMWDRAIAAFPEGFGPKEDPNKTLEKMLEPTDPFTSPYGQIDGAALGAEMAQNFTPTLDISIPDIIAAITINIPMIRLNGVAVSEALRVEQTQRLSSEARTRGAAGGGIIQ